MVATVRLDAPNAPAVCRAACEDVGFFYLENHGVSEDMIERVMDASRAFFSLPEAEKEKVRVNERSKGFTTFGEETLDPQNQKVGGTKEGYYIGRQVEDGDPELKTNPLVGDNQWPSEQAIPGWRETMLSYHAAMSKLGLRVVRLLASSLNLPPNFFDSDFTKPMATLRLLHYNDQTSDPNRGVFAAGAHSDYGMITLLLTDHVPGLQIKSHDNVWTPVPPRKGAFIVNLGDMLERWTNDRYRSTVHRVVNATGEERYSIPFFYEPNFDCVVSCIDSCGKAKYPPITSGQHLLEKYAQTHAHCAKED